MIALAKYSPMTLTRKFIQAVVLDSKVGNRTPVCLMMQTPLYSHACNEEDKKWEMYCGNQLSQNNLSFCVYSSPLAANPAMWPFWL